MYAPNDNVVGSGGLLATTLTCPETEAIDTSDLERKRENRLISRLEGLSSDGKKEGPAHSIRHCSQSNSISFSLS